MKRFPRVLLVTKSQIGDTDSAAASIRNWFKEWPRDHLAHVYSGGASVAAPFCSKTFQLGPAERRWGSLFFKLKASSLADSALPYRAPTPGTAGGTAVARAKQVVGKRLVESGLWELAFTPVLSKALKSFIGEFEPEALFVQGCDIAFMRLPILIAQAFGTSIHFNIVDDWVQHLYRGSPAGPLMGGVVDRAFRALAQASARRYTIGEAMAQAYRARYGLPFQVLMQCDDQERFDRAQPASAVETRALHIVYSGSLALGRWKAILDLAQACEGLNPLGKSIAITAYVPFVPGEAAEALSRARGVELKAAVPDADVPKALAKADLLFLPESFRPDVMEYVKLSVSTKAHLYMMSRRPTLVYGPAGIGTVEYARADRWAYVVDVAGPARLREAVRTLFEDHGLAQRLIQDAAAVAGRNHHGTVVRESLRRSLLAEDA